MKKVINLLVCLGISQFAICKMQPHSTHLINTAATNTLVHNEQSVDLLVYVYEAPFKEFLVESTLC